MGTNLDNSSKITLSVVMPAYNEEAHIKDNLLETSRILSGFLHRYEIIAVNDGSVDSTGQQIKEASEMDSHIIASGYEENQAA